ncbi:P22AR C-terminal domain-containing protein [Avibacterium paragallinarum]|uniref:P22AR C-terminal domain-containing protein n=1 Tax=Avibacterium paragallinarum TaxID=728 RepID=UPI00397B6793
MKNLTILNTQIRTLDNLYSLNDLHRASGGENKHQPFRFIRNEQTQSLISELQQDIQRSNSISGKSQTPNLVCRLVRGGCDTTIRGYWVCQELVIAYAAWISAAFHLKVIRAFMAINGIGTHPQQLALPEPEKKYTFKFTEYELEQLAWLWFSHKRMNTLLAELYEPLNALGSTYSGAVYSHAYEYKRHYEESQATLQRLIQPFTQSKKLNWQRVIPKISPAPKQLDF